MVNIPIINVNSLLSGTKEEQLETAKEIGKACKEVGFFIIVGHGVDPSMIDNTWSSTRNFFDRPVGDKLVFTKPQEIYPFGYNGFGTEVLSAGKAVDDINGNDAVKAQPADLKEMFSLGPSDPATKFPPREFPSEPAAFESSWTNYYDTMVALACRILKSFELFLELPENFFDEFVTHHASALRAINYPAIELGSEIKQGQLRASAHTDYGTITILKSDGPGLQVSKDTSPPSWHDVPYVEDGFVINLGDLMRRWTNEEWLSTLHRVIIPDAELNASSDKVTTKTTKRRQSLAFFHNINRDAVVECLLLNDNAVAKHKPIVAGDFLMQKHLASIGATAQS